MRCVICKQGSDQSRSVEHIIPESLGNTEHVLPPGIVCDSCNNYLAREVEKPFLASGQLRDDRFRMAVPSKKGRVPSILGVVSPLAVGVEIGRDTVTRDLWVSLLADQAPEPKAPFPKSGTFYFPVGAPPDDLVTARFVGKIGLEALAQRLAVKPELLEEFVDHPGFDDLRILVRRGAQRSLWPFSRRRIYATDHPFLSGELPIETLHEFDLLYTETQELFVVVAIFGIEYAMNLGSPSVDAYTEWLRVHGGISPLYHGKNAPM